MRVEAGLHKVVGVLPALKAISNEHYPSPWRNPVPPDTKVDVFGKSVVTSQCCCVQKFFICAKTVILFKNPFVF